MKFGRMASLRVAEKALRVSVTKEKNYLLLLVSRLFIGDIDDNLWKVVEFEDGISVVASCDVRNRKTTDMP